MNKILIRALALCFVLPAWSLEQRYNRYKELENDLRSALDIMYINCITARDVIKNRHLDAHELVKPYKTSFADLVVGDPGSVLSPGIGISKENRFDIVCPTEKFSSHNAAEKEFLEYQARFYEVVPVVKQIMDERSEVLREIRKVHLKDPALRTIIVDQRLLEYIKGWSFW